MFSIQYTEVVDDNRSITSGSGLEIAAGEKLLMRQCTCRVIKYLLWMTRQLTLMEGEEGGWFCNELWRFCPLPIPPYTFGRNSNTFNKNVCIFLLLY